MNVIDYDSMTAFSHASGSTPLVIKITDFADYFFPREWEYAYIRLRDMSDAELFPTRVGVHLQNKYEG